MGEQDDAEAHEEAEIPSIQIHRHPQDPLEGADRLLAETERVGKAHGTQVTTRRPLESEYLGPR